MTVKGFNSATNIYKLTKSYLSQSTAVMRTNNVYVEVSKSCPQGSCFGNGVWNIQYNSLLSLELREKIKTIVFGDESLVSVKTASIREAENNTNLGMKKKYQFEPIKTKSKLTSINQKLWLYHGGKEKGKIKLQFT